MIELRKTDEYNDWLRGLRDIQGRARINARINRLLDGNPGQHRVLTDGVVELKIDVGPRLPPAHPAAAQRLAQNPQ